MWRQVAYDGDTLDTCLEYALRVLVDALCYGNVAEDNNHSKLRSQHFACLFFVFWAMFLV